MRIDYDPAKNQANIEKHGISFERLHEVDWSTAVFRLDEREDYGEIRFVGVCYIDDRLHYVCFTPRGDGSIMRVISLHKANQRTADYYGQPRTLD
ncbi:BrnT family toxin [Aquisalimonas sp.]|uniref:BrnT family toxin n=1 Tax=Aquisalimonas sp. TaxID=1872621 RepID=UPI0025C332D9|nr:BrnT family toxin [Aquisalimonas sp.]